MGFEKATGSHFDYQAKGGSMNHHLGHCVVCVLVIGAFALVGCRSPEVKARDILDKHAAQFGKTESAPKRSRAGSGPKKPWDVQKDENELNRFLGSVRVLTVHREFVNNGDNSFWGLAVEYLDSDRKKGNSDTGSGRKRIDYREILPPEDFELFSRLREWRKEVAARESVPVYAIFTNDQLARISGARTTTKVALREIEGIGEAKASKYGEAVLEIVANITEDQKRKTPE